MPVKTYVPITTFTVSSATSSLTLTSIPSTYTDLVVEATIKPVNNGTAYLGVRVGSSNTLDTGTNYSWTHMYYTGTAVGPYSPNNESFIEAVGNQFQAKTLFTIRLDLMNYSSTSYNKTFFTDTRMQDNTARTGICLWRSNNAINTISIYNTANNNCIDAGSIITVYGIAKAV